MENDYVNRYEEILKRTQYFVANNYEITHNSMDVTLEKYFEDGGNDTYLIFEEKWSIDVESNASEIFAKATIKKSNKILELLKESNDNIESYVNRITSEVDNFVKERARELKLLQDTLKNNKTLEQKIGKKQFKIAFRKNNKKIGEIKEYFSKLNDELKKINEIKELTKLAVLGTYNFHNKKDIEKLQEDIKKEKELKREYNKKLHKFVAKIKKAISRIIVALQEKMIYLIETKYITAKKIIFKTHYREGKFWYLTKLFDKSYVVPVVVYDKKLQQKLFELVTI